MKNVVLFFLLSFFIEGVFGESVSVKEGDSVTLHTGLTEIQEDDVLEWRFEAGRVRIARVSKGRDPTTYDDVLDGRFRGRLKPDGQTGDLTITNITTEHDGPYEISINAIASRTFNVIGVSGVDEEKSVSVIVGDSVTLNSGTIIQRDDVIEWRFGDLNSPIAEHNRKTGIFSTYDGPDGRFRHRLKLDYRTGSLTIRNTTTEHTGVYEAGIRESSSTHTIHMSYSVTVSGEMKSASVMKGQSVTLHTDLTEIQTDDVMQWMFEDTVLAEINKAHKQNSTHDGPDGRFRDRLKLDHQTGSLNITNTTYTDSGLYELKIISSRFIINKRIRVTVTGLSTAAIAGICVAVLLLTYAVTVGAVVAVIYYRRWISAWVYKISMQSVMEGETITLTPDEDDEEHKDDKLLWMFRSACIAERKSAAESFTVYDDLPDKRFKGRLELDHKTGSLTITNTKTTDTGVYELLIIGSGKSSIKRFRVSVFDQTDDLKPVAVSVKKGESVTLETGVADIQKVERIQWMFGLNIRLAEITRETKKISPLADKILKVKLDLDHQTGSLTINKIRPTDAGIYLQRKIEGGKITTKLFKVVVKSTDIRNNPEESEPLRSVHADSRL